MSVDITTGLAAPHTAEPHNAVRSDTEAATTVAAAESVLSRRFGAPVRLDADEDLGGSDRSVVLRVRVAETPFSLPRTMVVKHYHDHTDNGRPDPFAHEAASSQLFTALTAPERVSPELMAHGVAERVLVMEDLGRAPTLADKLLGEDPRAAESSLLAWARALGRLHATTAGREADFDALMRRLGERSWRDPIANEARVALTELPELLAEALGVQRNPDAEAHAAGTAHLLEGTRYRAFSPSDVCPDNNLVTSRGVRFLDFEWGCMRDIALDAAYLRVPFPSCWCSFSLPPGMTEAMLAAWRAEVGVVWPDLDDDAVLLPRLLDAQVLWVWLSTWWLLPRTTEQDGPIDPNMVSPRRSAALADRWRRLHTDAVACGRIAVAEHAHAVSEAIVSRFGAEAERLPLYPAFR